MSIEELSGAVDTLHNRNFTDVKKDEPRFIYIAALCLMHVNKICLNHCVNFIQSNAVL